MIFDTQSKNILFLTVVSLAMISCGRNSTQKIQQKDGGSSGEDAKGNTSNGTPGGPGSIDEEKDSLAALADPNCTSDAKCPSVPFMLIDNTGVAAKQFSGTLKAEVKWSVSVKSNAIEGRLKISNKELPTWATSKAGSTVGSKVISGKPNQKTSSGQLIFIVRDLMKCKVSKLKDNLDDCLDPAKESKFDTKISVPYTIK